MRSQEERVQAEESLKMDLEGLIKPLCLHLWLEVHSQITASPTRGSLVTSRPLSPTPDLLHQSLQGMVAQGSLILGLSKRFS